MSFMTAVASNPSQGQYSVNSQTGIYTFNSADYGQYVSITYAYNDCNAEIKETALIQVAEILQKRLFHGLKSSGSPETGTTSYTFDVPRPPLVMEIMRKYRRAFVGV